MQKTKYGWLASAVMVASIAAPAAQASCPANSIIGTWDDSYGSVATITSETKGTATASSAVCSATGTIYALAITLTDGTPPKEAKVTAKAPKASGCPVVKATLKYNKGSCTVASGPVKFNGITLQDTWTKQPGAKVPARDNSALTSGLR